MVAAYESYNSDIAPAVVMPIASGNGIEEVPVPAANGYIIDDPIDGSYDELAVGIADPAAAPPYIAYGFIA
jgi:hypothetical protein